MKNALIVMAKQPLAGNTKTRLYPYLSGQQAADLYQCFLLDTLELMCQVREAQPIIAYAPSEAEPYFRGIAPPGFRFTPQRGADLAERLDNVLGHWLQNGSLRAVAIDSDSPTLPVAYLDQAFSALDDPEVDVVLGPCDDGGYYLIGLKSRCSALFDQVTMSTPTVLEETLQCAKVQGLRVRCLPVWYDVDTPADLMRLAQELRTLPDGQARHTRAFLE